MIDRRARHNHRAGSGIAQDVRNTLGSLVAQPTVETAETVLGIGAGGIKVKGRSEANRPAVAPDAVGVTADGKVGRSILGNGRVRQGDHNETE